MPALKLLVVVFIISGVAFILCQFCAKHSASGFRRREQNLFAKSAVKLISLFPVRDILFRFITFHSDCSTYGLGQIQFWTNTTTGSQTIRSHFFSLRNSFWRALRKKVSFLLSFQRTNAIFLSLVLTLSSKRKKMQSSMKSFPVEQREFALLSKCFSGQLLSKKTVK